jgi:hypothetical protein
LTTI